ncbi:MAG: hypothetical protein KatS3mg102_0781 [Planctomycetota bacterium]|nr:MAG: hypothetical protein KatS3mg102_0781 [Planctomycetota bacterium]
MPIVRVEALAPPELEVAALLERVAAATAAAFEVELRHCWVTFQPLLPGHYLEGGRVRASEDARAAAPLVEIIAYQGRTPARKARALRAVAEAVGGALGLEPDLVFVLYREIARGHVHVGGEVL